MKEEYYYIISSKLGHRFYLANLITIAYLLTANSSFCVKYGINLSLAFLSSLFYLLTYIRLNRMIIVDRSNLLKLGITLSSFLAWSNILFYTSIFIMFDSYENLFSKDIINLISFIVHLFIFFWNVLLIVFWKDLFYTIILFIYQLGITLQNKDLYSNEDKFTLVITIMSGIILLWSIFAFFKKTESQNISAELKQAYDREKE